MQKQAITMRCNKLYTSSMQDSQHPKDQILSKISYLLGIGGLGSTHCGELGLVSGHPPSQVGKVFA
jgi:hypothetical protein